MEYQGKETAWSYIIFLKTRELAHYLTGKKRKLDFATPPYEIERQDSDEMRRKILAIPYAEWKKMGFSKGTLHCLKKNSRDGKPFTMNRHVRGGWNSGTHPIEAFVLNLLDAGPPKPPFF